MDFSKPGKPYKVPADQKPIELQVRDVDAFQRNLDFTVQVFGADRNSAPISSIKETKLKVACRITAEATDETTTDGIRAMPTEQKPKLHVCDLPFKDSHNQYFFGSSKHSYEHRASAFLKDWVTAAVYSVTFVVTDSSQKIYPVEAPTVKFRVRAGPVHNISLYNSESWTTKGKQVQLGKESPDPMRFALEDADGNNVAAPPDLPEIRFGVKADPAYKSKKPDLTQDKTQKGKDPDPEKVFAMYGTCEKDPKDEQVLLLKNVVLDTKGKLHPKLNGRVNGKDKADADWKLGKARKVLGSPRSNGLQWRKATFSVAMRFDQEWIKSDNFIVNVLPGLPSAVCVTDLPADVQAPGGDEPICLKVNNGDTLPKFSVQLVDHVGINTHPAQRENHVCKVSAKHDVFAEDADLEVTFTAKGTAEFKRIVTHIADPSLFHRPIDLKIVCQGAGFPEWEGMEGLVSMNVAPSDRCVACLRRCVPQRLCLSVCH